MSKVIIALDFASAKETMDFLNKINEENLFVKLGMEIFYKEGPEFVKEIKNLGHKVFLDLKLHDIPNTVEKAMESVGAIGADMTNVHCAGGIKMMAGGKAGLDRASAKLGKEAILIAVTQLTSTSKETMNNEIMIPGEVEDVVVGYAKNCKAAGLNGVVCSPLEVRAIKEACGEDFITVTPGIRFEDGNKGDQVRVTTPKMARELGSDYIVVGRPITQAENPSEAYKRCVKEFMG